ncbi:hypothetical protein QQ008_10055 [Fulvivirgaceae bacterium BMA10]|uniref:Uncharacterized protein n=1 Tax=Splendidivirga corallicola TaxID=3051826 RepID=A0ABT8KPU2_9BACT|nr:hypothetical protein [Fulvivirgaceae bacterium BMA10]
MKRKKAIGISKCPTEMKTKFLIILPLLLGKSPFISAQAENGLRYVLLVGNQTYQSTIIKKGTHLGVERNRNNLGVQKRNSLKKEIPVITDLSVSSESPKYGLPNTWAYTNAIFYPIGFSEGNNRSYPSFGLFSIKEESLDTLNLRIKIENDIQEINAQFKTEQEQFKYYSKRAIALAKERKRIDVLPLRALFRNLKGISNSQKIQKGIVSYDLLINVNSEIELFIRDPWHFAHWKTNYPTKTGKEAKWEIVKAYTKDSVYLYREFVSHFENMPQSKNFVYRSISDSAFYQGKFKCVQQGETIFLINLKHGGIYLLSENSIKKVAQVDIGNSLSAQKKQVFIEDREKQVLVFIGSVQIIDESNAPAIKIINGEQALMKWLPGSF